MTEQQNIVKDGAGKEPKVKPTPNPVDKSVEKRLFILSSSPHIKASTDVSSIMWLVVATLVPTVIFSIYNFGWRCLTVIAVSMVTAMIAEELFNLIRRRKITIYDGSAALTGLLLALCLPPGLPLSMVIIGAAFSIIIGKQIFGGLGHNVFNPALLGRAFLQTSFPIAMTTWTIPRLIGAITEATPSGYHTIEKTLTPYLDLFLGKVGGCIGETSALAYLIRGLILILLHLSNWRIPVSYLGTVVVFSGILWLINPAQYPDPIFHLFSGGLMLGAFFMATDMVTSPITNLGTWIFGIGAGFLVVLIRQFGGLPEGVMYSILLMNGFVPLINRYTRPKYFGEVKS